MKRRCILGLLIVQAVIVLFIIYNHVKTSTELRNDVFTPSPLQSTIDSVVNKKNVIYLSVVVCGNRSEETFAMLRSATVLTNSKLHFLIFAEDALQSAFESELTLWRLYYEQRIDFSIYSIFYPNSYGVKSMQWKTLFKMCSSQRLFLPRLLPEIDSLLYVDTDVLFLTPLEDVWIHLRKMNGTQLAALAPEQEDASTGWYNRFARHPYYGKLGLNSGVMLMNLTRMRSFGWEEYVAAIYRQYHSSLIWGDQDILNILFHFHPERLYVYDCRYNFRPDHCMYMPVCKEANDGGVIVLHGSRGTFHKEKYPAFNLIYSLFRNFTHKGDVVQHLIKPLENYQNAVKNPCDDIDVITKRFRRKVAESGTKLSGY